MQNRAKKSSEIENHEEDRRRKYATFIPANSDGYRTGADTSTRNTGIMPSRPPLGRI